MKKTNNKKKKTTVKKEIKPILKKDDFQKFLFQSVEKINNEIPEFVETRGKDYINYGKDNMYPTFLINLLNNSSKHSAAVRRKTTMTAGAGFEDITDSKLKEFEENKFGKESLSNIALKNAYDLNIFGGFGLIITWSKDGKSISRIKHISNEKFRIHKELSEDDFGTDEEKQKIFDLQQKGVDFFGISSDWGNVKKKENEIKLIQGFSKEHRKNPNQLLYVRTHTPSVDFYTLPEYKAAIKWIMLDDEVINFHLNSIQNGFTPSMIISFKNGIPTDEEMKLVKRQLNEQYAGSSKGSEVFITYTESEGEAPEFITIQPNANDRRFLQLEEQIQTNIVIAHNGSNIVFGISSAGKLGNSSEIFQAELVFQKNVIDPKQKMLENTYNMLAGINGIEEKLQLKTALSFDKDFIENWIKPQFLSSIKNNEELIEQLKLKIIEEQFNIDGIEGTVKIIQSTEKENKKMLLKELKKLKNGIE